MKYLALLTLAVVPKITFAQEDYSEDDAFLEKLGSQIFLPSIEMGYMGNRSENLSGGILVKTSIEYRVRNNNDAFIRANYDTENADFTLTPINGLTNVIEGTASFTDLLIGPGYRFGDNKVRCFLMVQAGAKLYNYPEFVANNTTVSIVQGRRGLFSTRATLGFEYYLNEKSAISFDLIQGQIWNQEDFWVNSGTSFGFSLGFITALL